MKSLIYVIRESGEMEHHVTVEVSLDGDGDIEAKVFSDVPERFLSRRFGPPEPDFSGVNLYDEGDEIELTDDEIEEAKAELGKVAKDWDNLKSKAFSFLNPSVRKEAAEIEGQKE